MRDDFTRETWKECEECSQRHWIHDQAHGICEGCQEKAELKREKEEEDRSNE